VFLARDSARPPRVGVTPIPPSVPSGAYQLTLQVGHRVTPTQPGFTAVAETTMPVLVKD
jgi:hypothetical protein